MTKHLSFNRINFYNCFLCGFLLFGSSCTKNDGDFGPQDLDPTVPVPENNRIIVLNEGNFMWGNGSLSVIDEETEGVANEVFSNQNSFPLGDVAQSLLVHDSLGYIVVNNSGKIEVVNMDDFSSIKTITGFTSPRFIEVVSTNPLKAWVTDLYANKIWVVDLESSQIVESIPSQGWNENMLKWNNDMLVLNKTDSVIHVWDILSKQKVKTYSNSAGISDFKKWSEDEIVFATTLGVFKINLSTDVETTLIEFYSKRNPVTIAVDTLLNDVLFLDGALYRFSEMSPNDGVVEVLPVVSGSSWYGLHVNSLNGSIMVTDAKDYVQPGNCNVYSSDFTTTNSFNVGINPQFIWVE